MFLSRRSFHTSIVAASCLSGGPDDLVDPRMSLVVPADAPRIVALTLDACSGAVDLRIIDTLLTLSVPATLFVTGLWLRSNAHILPLLLNRRDLFTLQNHGERHLPAVLGTRHVYGLPVAGTADAIRREIVGGADAILAAGAPGPRWYRGAAALYSRDALVEIDAMNIRVAGYSMAADDGASLPAAAVEHRMARAVSGDIILAHVNQPHRPSGAGVAAGIARLHAAGVVFAGLDLLPVTALTCRPRPGPVA